MLPTDYPQVTHRLLTRYRKVIDGYRWAPTKLERIPKYFLGPSGVKQALLFFLPSPCTLRRFPHTPRQTSPHGLIRHQPQGSPSASSPRSYFFNSPPPTRDNASAVEENRENWSPRVREWMPAPASLSPMISENGMSLPGSPTREDSRCSGRAGRLVSQRLTAVAAVECAEMFRLRLRQGS